MSGIQHIPLQIFALVIKKQVHKVYSVKASSYLANIKDVLLSRVMRKPDFS